MKPLVSVPLYPSARSVFPGEIAGASLKHAPREAARHRPVDVFPGEIAGASLKRK